MESQENLFKTILAKCTNDTLKSITMRHCNTLLSSASNVSQHGVFGSKDDARECAIAKFYFDKCLPALKPPPEEIEDGEINSDSEGEAEKHNEKSTQINEGFPPLEAFHVSPTERKKRIFDFWLSVKKGEIYNAKVVDIMENSYNLIIVNKYQDKERLIDLTINAVMKKCHFKGILNISDLVRVSATACTKVNNVFKVVVIAEPAEIGGIKLGKIPETDLPFLPIEACKFRSLTQYVTAICPDKDIESVVKNIKSLGIDPYRTYCLDPEISDKKSKSKKVDDKEISKKQLDSVKALAESMRWNSKGDIPRAMSCVNKALELNPEYDLAYSIRGSLFKKKAEDKEGSSFLRCAALDFKRALELNSHCDIALKEGSALHLKSAIAHLSSQEYLKTHENLNCATRLQKNEEAEKLKKELKLFCSNESV